MSTKLGEMTPIYAQSISIRSGIYHHGYTADISLYPEEWDNARKSMSKSGDYGSYLVFVPVSGDKSRIFALENGRIFALENGSLILEACFSGAEMMIQIGCEKCTIINPHILTRDLDMWP
jgi:hypothetical protein